MSNGIIWNELAFGPASQGQADWRQLTRMHMNGCLCWHTATLWATYSFASTTQKWHKIPVFGADGSFEIKPLQSRFCCPRIQHDTLPHRPASNKVARPPVLTKHLLEPRSTFYVRLFHMTSSNKASFQLTPISHRIVGVNNKCSKDNRLVTA